MKAGDGSLILHKMSLLRRLRHQASRRQLVREGFSCYILAFLVVFLDLHFIGLKHYTPSFHREHLPFKVAAYRAAYWGLGGPILWLLDDALRRNELWTSFWSLDARIQGLALAVAAVVIVATIVAWQWMLPVWGLAVAVTLYLRLSRSKDSL